MNALYVGMSVSFCLPHPTEMSTFLFVGACMRVLGCYECVCGM